MHDVTVCVGQLLSHSGLCRTFFLLIQKPPHLSVLCFPSSSSRSLQLLTLEGLSNVIQNGIRQTFGNTGGDKQVPLLFLSIFQLTCFFFADIFLSSFFVSFLPPACFLLYSYCWRSVSYVQSSVFSLWLILIVSFALCHLFFNNLIFVFHVLFIFYILFILSLVIFCSFYCVVMFLFLCFKPRIHCCIIIAFIFSLHQ